MTKYIVTYFTIIFQHPTFSYICSKVINNIFYTHSNIFIFLCVKCVYMHLILALQIVLTIFRISIIIQ